MDWWVSTWLRTLLGSTPKSDPWNDDPTIRAERLAQHERIDRATGYSAQDQRELRQRRIEAIEETWRRGADA